MRFRRSLSLFLILSIALFAFPALPVFAGDALAASASSAILFHPASGAVLFEKDADRRRPIASTTKIMTALTVLAGENDLNRSFTVPLESTGIEGSSLYLQAGETLTVMELLYGLMLASANDAATALACAVAGSVPAFAEKMNRMGRELGLCDSHFANPHGLDDPDHYSTARDLARLTAAALENDVFKEIVATRRYSIAGVDGGKRYLSNHNKLLSLYPDCIGVKTGFTKKSGRCLVSAAERDGITLIAVTLNDPNDWNDHIALFDYGFSIMEKRTVLKKDELVLECPVVNGDTPTVKVTNAEEITLTLPSSVSTPKRLVSLPHFLPAPLRQGEIAGYVAYEFNGKVIGESPLVVAEPIGEILYKKGLFHR